MANGGRFWIPFDALYDAADSYDIIHGQESRFGGDELAEWQPRLDMKPEETTMVLMEFCKDVDFRRDSLAFSVW